MPDAVAARLSEPIFQSNYQKNPSTVHKYFQILGHRPPKLLTWHPDPGAGRGEGGSHLTCPYTGSRVWNHQSGSGDSASLASFSPVLVGSNDAYRTDL